MRWSAPSIWVALSSWPDTNLDSGRIQYVAGLHQHQINVPIGFLGKLKIGDIWRNGELVASPEYQRECFTGVTVDRGAASLIKAGLSTKVANRDVFYLPLGAHPYHSAHTGAYCLLVNLPEGKRLIIPAVELIRFYFGSSFH